MVLLILGVKGCNPRKNLPLQKLEGRAAASGDVRHLVRKPGLFFLVVWGGLC